MIANQNRWQLQHAKARLSEVIQRACIDGPQTITLRGKDKAVVVSAEEYDRLTCPPLSIAEALARFPIREEDVDTIFARQPYCGDERHISFEPD